MLYDLVWFGLFGFEQLNLAGLGQLSFHLNMLEVVDSIDSTSAAIARHTDPGAVTDAVWDLGTRG